MTQSMVMPKIDLEFISQLEVLDQTKRPMPGAWIRRTSVDSRLPGLKMMMTGSGTVGPKDSDEICLCEHLALLRHKASGKTFVVFQETMDALLERQADPVKYPEWLMKHPVKATELKIFVARVIGQPSSKYDKSWIEFLDEGPEAEKVFESICFFLIRKHVITEQMYGKE